MTQIVADASIVGNVFLADERTELTEFLLEKLVECDLVEPAHWPIEACGLVLKVARRERLNATERDVALESTLRLIGSAQVESTARSSAAIALALRYQLSIYDAAYLEASLRLDLPLLTADKALLRAAPMAGASLVSMQ